MGALFDKYMARWDASEAEKRKDYALLEDCLKEMHRIADFGVRKTRQIQKPLRHRRRHFPDGSATFLSPAGRSEVRAKSLSR
jgi:hypothetical protein